MIRPPTRNIPSTSEMPRSTPEKNRKDEMLPRKKMKEKKGSFYVFLGIFGGSLIFTHI
jgi:hypothetical protein